MTDQEQKDSEKKVLTLSGRGLQEARRTIERGGTVVAQQLSGGGQNAVVVQRKRTVTAPSTPQRAPKTEQEISNRAAIVRESIANKGESTRLSSALPSRGGIAINRTQYGKPPEAKPAVAATATDQVKEKERTDTGRTGTGSAGGGAGAPRPPRGMPEGQQFQRREFPSREGVGRPSFADRTANARTEVQNRDGARAFPAPRDGQAARPVGDRPLGDRPPRTDRPFGDRPPRTDRPAGDRPPGDRPFGDRPRPAARPFTDRAPGDRPPRGDGSRAPGDRPARPPFDRSGSAPRGGLSTGERDNRARVLQQSQTSTGPGGTGNHMARPTGIQMRQIGKPSFAPRPLTATGMDDARRKSADRSGNQAVAKLDALRAKGLIKDEDPDAKRVFNNGPRPPSGPARRPSRPGGARRHGGGGAGRITVTQALNGDIGTGRFLSDAARRRLVQKSRRHGMDENREKVARDVTIPDTITVQELANRMAEPSGVVIKTLMRLGIMATINQVLDADTAELLATELGHRFARVSESDVEIGLGEWADTPENLKSRPPVVTIMGHVDHGKTSLLDAIRSTDVVSGESGGITQHIGAYQVKMGTGQKITFLDTPGHAAFTEMRSRGAHVTDVVVLVVAADDGLMPQTIEAISHAKAAGVPVVVAINKIDKEGANPGKIKGELLQYNIQVEELGGDVQAIEVSAKQKLNLDKLEAAIMVQAEILDLKANPDRPAVGRVIESKQQIGRGATATVLVQKGTLRTGDIFVCGTVSGRVRALHDDHGKTIKEAEPGKPVEVIGLEDVPRSGDDFVVVENEQKAREIAEFRQRKQRELYNLATKKTSLDQMFSDIQTGAKKELAIIVKGDVHGSVEAIAGAMGKLTEDNPEVTTRIIHSGVGAINESDISLANASKALVMGFNVRANPQARDLAKRDGIDIRYYSIIYDIIEDVTKMLTGMLKPVMRENFLGYAEIREVFNITRVGKVAGCYVTEGLVKRGANVRLLRENVVIHEGKLKTLKRFKEEVKEVKDGTECGMAFENYEDIRAGDMIECFELEEVARSL